MNQPKLTAAQAFNDVAQQIMELPTKIGNKPQNDHLWSCLEVLKGLVEAHVKAEQEAAATKLKSVEAIPGVVPQAYPVAASS